MKKIFLLALLGLPWLTNVAIAQTSYTSTSATSAWNAARWNNSADAAPYTSSYTANNAVNFTSGTYNFAGMGASTNVGNITVNSGANVSFSAGSTFATNGSVRTINIASGSVFDFNGQQISTAVGTGFIISGSGVFGTGAYTLTANVRSFRVDGGTVIARGTTGLGNGSNSSLVLNGGTIASNDNRSFDNTRFGAGISIGGNVQFGELATNVALASSSANLSFANNVSLGSATRTLTQGNNGTNTFSAIISNSGTGGITFAANPGTDGRFAITNAANTFTGDININGGEVRFTTDGSMGNAANDIIIDGGRFGKASDATTVTLGAGRTISVGNGAGTSISSAGAGTLIYNGTIADKTSETGSWAKQGGGVLELGGVSTYTGSTAINNGILRLTTGNDRLPTGTVVSLGQAASANLGTLDLNGRNQQIAGLNSVTGTNAGVNTNVVTSLGPAVLTLNTTSNAVYSDGTAANSGVISGAISLVKTGAASQTLGGANTYTGTTTVNAGVLVVNGTHTGGGLYTINGTGTLMGTGTITAAVNVASGGTLAAGNSIGTLEIIGDLSFTAGSTFAVDINTDTLTSDLLKLTGKLTLGGASLVLTDLGANTPRTFGNTLTIATYTGGLTGTFAGLANDQTFTFGGNQWKINYGTGPNGAITFSAVPEPSALLFVGSIVGAGLLRRRRA